ncbi:MAG TPA: energy transducer TonB [Acetobacteraceae bacterium]|nr:energy transducer TonB [Acetobacteraceae bacterium]
MARGQDRPPDCRRFQGTDPEMFLPDQPATDIDPVVPDSRLMRRSALASLALHGLLLAPMGLWLTGGRLPEAAEQGIKVELVMLEQAGSGKPLNHASPPAQPAPIVPAAPARPTPPPSPAMNLPLPPPPPPRREPVPPRQPPPPRTRASATVPPGPQMNQGGTDSPSDAIAQGDNVIPAKPDALYHNREPAYPPDAVLRGEQGVVVLVVHVSPAGLPSAVEVAQSSGFLLLDQAARKAVETWHFLPAVRDGQPIAAEMPLRVRFELDGGR